MVAIFFAILSAAVLLNSAVAAPEKFDWRLKGVVPPVRNQGALGISSYFAVVEAIESYHTINTGHQLDLSIDELADCCPQPLNAYGCVLKLHGLCSEADYPKTTGKCHNSTCIPDATISGYKSVMAGNETALKKAVLINPVSAMIDASQPSFQLYKGGVYKDAKCSSQRLDHVLLIVGYGSLNGQDYWICQNSWGTSWGMNGYIFIARNKGNMCGIATAASYPI